MSSDNPGNPLGLKINSSISSGPTISIAPAVTSAATGGTSSVLSNHPGSSQSTGLSSHPNMPVQMSAIDIHPSAPGNMNPNANPGQNTAVPITMASGSGLPAGTLAFRSMNPNARKIPVSQNLNLVFINDI